jgi:hypothetical protein
MPDNTHTVDDIIDTLIDSHLKLAMITSSLLFACRTATRGNSEADQELDSTSKDIDDYINTIEKAMRELKERRQSVGRT